MPDLWFVLGLALGVVVTGFCAVGSFERGADSVRHAPWRLELSQRKHAVVARATAPAFDPVAVPVVARSPRVARVAARRERRAQRPVFIPYGEREETRISV